MVICSFFSTVAILYRHFCSIISYHCNPSIVNWQLFFVVITNWHAYIGSYTTCCLFVCMCIESSYLLLRGVRVPLPSYFPLLRYRIRSVIFKRRKDDIRAFIFTKVKHNSSRIYFARQGYDEILCRLCAVFVTDYSPIAFSY